MSSSSYIRPELANEILGLLQEPYSRLSLGLSLWQTSAVMDPQVTSEMIANVLCSFTFKFLAVTIPEESREKVHELLTDWSRVVIVDQGGDDELDTDFSIN